MMKRGGKFLVSAGILTIAACGGERADLKVRSIPTPLAQGAKPVPFRIAEARGQLALGNVALALEGFRKAWRDDPDSIDALAGMATCYDRMGRFDLSRRNYEAALALAPANVELLGAFAQSLQLQGQAVEAQKVRVEIAQRLEAQAPTPEPDAASQVAVRAPMPIPRPALAAAPIEVAERTSESRVDVAAPALPHPQIVEEAAPAPVAAPLPVKQVAAGPSVTIKLPPARKVEAVQAVAAPPAPVQLAAATVELPSLKPYNRPVPKPAVVEEQGPRLERLSMGEISLITAPGPVWQATTVARTERSTTVRWVSLDESARSSRVRLLNAARVNRLAARTRTWLVAHGWSDMAIGDAPAARSRSVILYPARERVLARTLANQFGFAMEERADAKFVTMLLGRDAAQLDELRPKTA